jgi:hypothetical protein
MNRSLKKLETHIENTKIVNLIKEHHRLKVKKPKEGIAE